MGLFIRLHFLVYSKSVFFRVNPKSVQFLFLAVIVLVYLHRLHGVLSGFVNQVSLFGLLEIRFWVSPKSVDLSFLARIVLVYQVPRLHGFCSSGCTFWFCQNSFFG